MATIDHSTHVVITMKQMLWGIGLLLGGGAAVLWAVLMFTVGGVRDDVSAIRGDMGKLQESALAAPGKLNEAQITLTRDIGALRADLAGFRGDFRGMQVALDDLKGRVDDLQKKGIKKVEWDFTKEDGDRLVSAIKANGLPDKNNIVVVPLVAAFGK